MATALSSRDIMVLQTLFDAPPSAAASASNAASLPQFTENNFTAVREQEQNILRPLSAHPQDNTNVTGIVQELSKLIDEHPQYASAYVNRAQATRLLFPMECLFSSGHASESASVISDLNRAIELATPTDSSGSASLHQSEVLASAHSHRGFLLLKAADMVKTGQSVHGLNDIANATATSIEEIASEDFVRGGRHGNALSRQMAVITNPYAKMCGAIVRDALHQEIAAAAR